MSYYFLDRTISSPLEGLKFFIEYVETLSIFDSFCMCSSSECIIGKFLCEHEYNEVSDWYNDINFVKKLFNINLSHCDNGFINSYFRKTNRTYEGNTIYNKNHWKIMRLFTGDIGDYISVRDWLLLAKQVVEEFEC